MTEKKFSSLSPVKLRIALLMSIAAIVIISAVGFWFFRGWLESYATSVSEDAQKVEASNSSVTNLQNVKKELEENSVAVNRTKNIIADSKSYAYQNQIINDIDAFAKASGVTIAGYGFATTDATTGTAAASPDAAPAPAGLKTTSITVTINNPVRYQSIMNFIHSIESNLTKMQIAGITLRQDPAGGSDSVSIEPISVEVYIK